MIETLISHAGSFVIGFMIGVIAIRAFAPTQSCVVKGARNFVSQSGCVAGGDIVGGDLIKRDK